MKIPKITKRAIAFLKSEEGSISKQSALKMCALSAIFLFAEKVSANESTEGCIDNSLASLHERDEVKVKIMDGMFEYYRKIDRCDDSGGACDTCKIDAVYKLYPTEKFFQLMEEEGNAYVNEEMYDYENHPEYFDIENDNEYNMGDRRIHSKDWCYLEVHNNTHASSSCGTDHLNGGGLIWEGCIVPTHSNELNIHTAGEELHARHLHSISDTHFNVSGQERVKMYGFAENDDYEGHPLIGVISLDSTDG